MHACTLLMSKLSYRLALICCSIVLSMRFAYFRYQPVIRERGESETVIDITLSRATCDITFVSFDMLDANASQQQLRNVERRILALELDPEEASIIACTNAVVIYFCLSCTCLCHTARTVCYIMQINISCCAIYFYSWTADKTRQGQGRKTQTS